MKSRKKVSAEQVKAELLNEKSVDLLRELHLLTRDGELNADARRKLKQVNHLIQLIKPAWDDVVSRHKNLCVVDVGSGKSYLGFIFYDTLVKPLLAGSEGHTVDLVSVEAREDLVTKVESMAKRLGFDQMRFLAENIESVLVPDRVHLLMALHACDTATDDAIIAGLKSKADYIVLVPCCQAEVARQLQELPKPTATGGIASAAPELWHHGIHRREFGSHLTNVLRVLILESLGYSVSVTELVGWEHSLKNEFILAKRVNQENKQARMRLEALLKEIPVRPKLVRHVLGSI